MNVTETSLLGIAIANTVVAIVCVIVAVRLLPVLRQARRTLRRSQRVLGRLGRMTRELEYIAQDARQLEGRVARSAHGVLDQVEPILGALRGVIAGTRSGLGTLFSRNGVRSGRRRGRPDLERSRT